METKQKERIRRLMELLKKTDRIHLKDAARMLEVSVMTIRRDLSQENDEPLPLTLLGGYVVMVNKPSSPSVTPALATKPAHHRDELPIAILAAGLVSENDLVFFDNGSEMPLVINMIPDDITFTGICYSHRVFMALNEKPNATAILCGGTYRAKSDAFYDTGNPSALDSLNPRKVFISASGVHEHFASAGLTPTTSPRNVKRWIAACEKSCSRAMRCSTMLRLPVLRRCRHLMC